MREVDQALARAFAQRSATERDTVPPAPHVAPRAAGPDPGHFELDPLVLRWPATVLTLERDYGDRFSRLADSLLAARDRLNLKVLLFTSCRRAEGRSTLILTLARALGRAPGRTLLVDADLTNPNLARLLGFAPAAGLDDVVDQGHARFRTP